ncbi:MAG TPA: tail fiber domain-containing protein, partial [bacterium]|nr:tail fiber domain-containing protein [bacterium]
MSVTFSSGNGIAVLGGTDVSTGWGVVGSNGVSSISGGGGAGVYGTTNVSDAAAVYGTTSSSSGFGVEGINTSTSTGTNNIGVYGTSSGWGGYFVSSGTSSTSGGLYAQDTNSGSWAGYFDGAVNITGALTVGSCSGCTSDVRLKKNVRPLRGAIDQLLQLKGVTFEWKNPSEHENDARTQTGFVAQEVERVFPGWVRDDGYTAPDGEKYKTLELRQIEALEVESIRELNTTAGWSSGGAGCRRGDVGPLHLVHDSIPSIHFDKLSMRGR